MTARSIYTATEVNMSNDDKILLVLTIASLMVLSFYMGMETANEKHCELKGGEYSWDFGKCLKVEVVK
jgi:hypothetical protein